MKKVNNKKLKKHPDTNLDIYKEIRHFDVLIEHVDEKVGLVAEQYGDLKKDIGGLKKTLDSHTEMIGGLAIDVSLIKEDISFIKILSRKKLIMMNLPL